NTIAIEKLSQRSNGAASVNVRSKGSRANGIDGGVPASQGSTNDGPQGSRDRPKGLSDCGGDDMSPYKRAKVEDTENVRPFSTATAANDTNGEVTLKAITETFSISPQRFA